MFSSKFSKPAISVLLMLAGTQAYAQSIVAKDCEACTQQQIVPLVRECQNGYDYVSDFRSNKIYKACFVLDVNDGVRPPVKTKDLFLATVESNIQQSFQAYENVYTNNNLTMGYTAYLDLQVNSTGYLQKNKFESFATNILNVFIPTADAQSSTPSDNGSVNAYDTVVSSSYNNQVINVLNTKAFDVPSLTSANPGMGSGLIGSIAIIENSVKSDVISFSNFNATYIVNFPDGSQRTYNVDFVNKTFKAVPGTAKDAHGNVIPENTAMVSNGNSIETRSFQGNPNYDLTNFVNLAKSFGAVMGNVSQTVPLRCSWDGKTLDCANYN
jgi:hypothetical protein